MADKSKTIIVKKVKKGHSEAHGGSWKVAYADFVTAMMAFFLLLWLISMVTPEKRALVADYFKNFNLFKESGRSFMAQQSGIKQEIKTSSLEPASGEKTMIDVSQKIKTYIDTKLKGLQDQVIIKQVEGGVKIEIVDLDGKPMFRSGSAVPTERCRQILRVVTESIKDSRVTVSVEGHTDSAGGKKAREKNWELSVSRAFFARKMLLEYGLPQDKISKVVGYADTDLIDPQNPLDAKNRRISLLLSPVIEKKPEITAPAPEETPQALPLMPPSAEPAPTVTKPAESAPVPKEPPANENNKKKVIDPGIAPKKPIDIRPTLFPGMNQ